MGSLDRRALAMLNQQRAGAGGTLTRFGAGGGLAAAAAVTAAAAAAASAGGGSSGASPGGPAAGARASTAGKSTLRQMRNMMAQQAVRRKFVRRDNTLTVNSRDYMLKLLKLEGALSVLVTRTVLSVLVDFYDDCDKELDPKTRVDLCTAVLELLCAVTAAPIAVPLSVASFSVLRLYARRLGEAVFAFSEMQRLVAQLAQHAFRHCLAARKEVRREALALVFILLVNNFRAHNQLHHLQVALTVSLSELAPSLDRRSTLIMRNVFSALPEYFTRDAAWQEQADPEVARRFREELDSLINKLTMILVSQTEIARQTALGDVADVTTTELLMLQIADAFSHMPEIRVQWLGRLAEHNRRDLNFAEAAQCYTQIGDLLRTVNPSSHSSRRDTVETRELISDEIIDAYKVNGVAGWKGRLCARRRALTHPACSALPRSTTARACTSTRTKFTRSCFLCTRRSATTRPSRRRLRT